MTVLGISIGTSRTGICVLQNGVLLERQVHDYPALWSDKKLHSILKRYRQYLHKYPVTSVIVNVPPATRQTKALMRLVRRVEALAAEYYCDFDLITKIELKGVYNLRSTDEIIRFTTLLYPDLSALYKKGIATKHRFYKKLYEAVLSAHIFQERRRAKSAR